MFLCYKSLALNRGGHLGRTWIIQKEGEKRERRERGRGTGGGGMKIELKKLRERQMGWGVRGEEDGEIDIINQVRE